MKKIGAIILVVFIAFGWMITVTDIGNGPIAEKLKLGLDLKGGVYVILEAETDAVGAELNDLMTKTQQVIERRVNALGLSEPNVIREGDNRILVEMPGVEDASEAIDAIGRTAQLEFLSYVSDIVITGDMIHDTGTQLDPEDPR